MVEKADMKETFGRALMDIAASGREIAVVDADLMRIAGTRAFRDAYPERYFEVGIAEQNLVGVAAGLALMGRAVFATTFSNFISLRAADQICNTVCYNNLNVKVCGIYAGISSEINGGTHISVADVAVLRSLPAMRIVDPGDGNEFYQAVRCAAETEGPFYIRISKGPMATLFPPEYRFILGKGVLMQDGNDITLVTGGLTTEFGIRACALLREQGIAVRHIHMPTIKPIDSDMVLKAARETGKIVVAENHSVIGGLGSAIAETVCGKEPVPVIRLGVNDEFCVGAKVDYLSCRHQISADAIAARIREEL
jgi:transketolase